METAPFYKFPAHQAVHILHPEFDNQCGLIAVVAPTLTRGVSHVGICDVQGSDWRFINGPSATSTEKVWRKLFDISESWEWSTSTFLEESDRQSKPALSPDDFIDLVTGGTR